MDATTLHQRLSQGSVIEGADLSGIDWQERCYEDPVFVDCRFDGIRFIGTQLSGARFTECRFMRCRFSHADLRRATFQHCVLVDRTDDPQGCHFGFSDLRDARLGNATFRSVYSTGVICSRSNWPAAICWEPASPRWISATPIAARW